MNSKPNQPNNSSHHSIMNTFTILEEVEQLPRQTSLAASNTALHVQAPTEAQTKPKKTKKKKKTKSKDDANKSSDETRKPKKKKSSTKAKGDIDNGKKVNNSNHKSKAKVRTNLSQNISGSYSLPKTFPISEDETTFVGTSLEDFFYASSSKSIDCDRNGAQQPQKPARSVSFGTSGVFDNSLDDTYRNDASITLDYGNDDAKTARSVQSLGVQEPPVRSLSYLATSIKSFLSMGSEHRPRDRRARSSGRRSAFARSRENEQNKNFRISKNPTKMKAERIEAFFYNHGMEIALGVLYLALNILVGAHGAYQFTEIGGWTTDDDILRVTLPIARAGGRLVTLNCAILLLTACKYLWTCVRTYVAPILPIGFPIDNIMPKYHRYVALTVIVSGCIIHTLPQIVNYASRSIKMDHDGMRIWTFGDGFATKQLLLTGTLLTIIFSTFFVTTMKSFRKTAAGFRWFWFFHMGGIATAYPLLLIHGTCRGRPVFLYFALVPLILYLFDIAMRRSNVSTTEVLEWITHEDEGQQITELVIECPKNFVYTPGQYAELKFPPISNSEWHPFTIASAPNEGGDENGKISEKKKIVFYIKNSGRWTEALYSYASAFDLAKAKNSTTIQIRGPHGAPAMNYFEYKHIVVIGSGVGVTPLLSIWKYLVEKGKTMVYNPEKNAKNSVFSQLNESQSFHDEDVDEFSKSTVLFDGEGETASISELRSTCIFLEKVFESMTVSMSLLVFFVLGETLTFVLQMFGYGSTANTLGSSLTLVAFLVHGSTVAVSAVALGRSNYFKLFKCWIECTIIIADLVAALALYLVIKDRVEPGEYAVQPQQNTSANTAYFLFFGLVVVLHAIRIFHIFYMTLKPTSYADTTIHDTDANEDSAKSLSASYSSKGESNQEVCSIDGILINRMYSNMKFAARSLLRPIIEDGLADLFSMEFYGTREKSKDRDRSEHGLISDMMGSQGDGLDIRMSMGKHRHDEYFHPGRPDWNKIFMNALAKAHRRNPKGESVGVFFCGSPAIAKDLQCSAAEVTARHQFSMKHLDGKACKCKLIVHSENF